MNPQTLKSVLGNKALSEETTREVRTIGLQAREDRRTLVDRMNDQMLLSVAKAAGAVVSVSADSYQS